MMEGLRSFVVLFVLILSLEYTVAFHINIHTCKEENFELTMDISAKTFISQTDF